MRMKALVVIAGAAVSFVLSGKAAAQEGSADGVEVLTRGPVHEAYAEAVDANPQAAPMVSKKPPDPIPEMPPDQKPEGDKVEWISGYWAWDADRKDYIWVSGFWRTPPPGRAWVPGHWQEASEGWQWVGGFWNGAEKAELAYVPPPPEPIEERAVPSPGEGHFYTPGVWVYRDGRYMWRPGTWVAFHEDYVWVPAHYIWTPAGHVFIEGYWDYVLHRRGLLFAPVYVSPDVVVRTEFCYVPRHVVCHEFMIGCLFVRPACHHYYYGDYFEARYTDAGYVAFVDYRIGGHYHDPLFGYYAHYPPSREWERETRAVYVGRFHGDVVRPPHTFAEQERQHVSLTVSIGEADRHGVKMERISHEQVVHAHEAAVVRHEAAVERQKVEVDLHSRGPIKAGDAPHVVKFDAKTPTHTETGSPQPGHGGTPPQGPSGTGHVGGSTPTGGGAGSPTGHGGTTPSTGGTNSPTGVVGSTPPGSGQPRVGSTPPSGSGTTPPASGTGSTGTGTRPSAGSGSGSKGSGSHPPQKDPPPRDKDKKDKKDHQQ